MNRKPTVCGLPVTGSLGAGAYGKVWAGTYQGRPVAIKEVCGSYRQEGICEPAEIDIMRRLSHPNISRIIGLYTECADTSGIAYILELGFSSLRGIFKNSHYSLPARLRNLYQVAMALNFLHEADVLHLDIKPDNIILFGGVINPLAKVTDFGISAYMKNGVFDSNTNRLTPTYRSPELLNYSDGEIKSYTGAADAWAYGATYYEILSGKPWAHHYTSDIPPQELIQQIAIPDKTRHQYINSRINSVKDPQLKTRIVDLLYGLLDPNPGSRFTMKRVVEEGIGDGIVVDGSEASVPYPSSINQEVLEGIKILYSLCVENRPACLFFAAVDLLYRCNGLLQGFDPKTLSTACYYLAASLTLSTTVAIRDEEVNEIVQAQVEILNHTRGILYRRYLWDAARTVQQLRDLYNTYVYDLASYNNLDFDYWYNTWGEPINEEFLTTRTSFKHLIDTESYRTVVSKVGGVSSAELPTVRELSSGRVRRRYEEEEEEEVLAALAEEEERENGEGKGKERVGSSGRRTSYEGYGLDELEYSNVGGRSGSSGSGNGGYYSY